MSSKEHQTTNGHWTMCFEKSYNVKYILFYLYNRPTVSNVFDVVKL